MTDLRTAAQQALDYWERAGWAAAVDAVMVDKMDALRAALAQQAEPRGGGNLPPPLQAEPVAWIHRQGDFWEFGCHRLTDGEKARGWTEEPLYRAPPQRLPLTKEEIMRAFYAAEKTPMSIRHGLSVVESARIVERAHGIKE